MTQYLFTPWGLEVRMRTAVLTLALLVFPGGMLLDARAASRPCDPLKQVASLKMTMLPGGSRISVPLTINGTAVSLLVDTGAGMSSLTGPAATSLGMKQRNSDAMRLFNKDGVAVHRYYVADNFQLGQLAAKNIPFIQDADIDDARVSGTIAPDLMVRYDVDMDFSEQKLTYFSQDHCPGHVVHWSSDSVTQVPISIVARAKDYPPPLVPGAIGGLPADFVEIVTAKAITPILGTDIRAKVMLDGHLFTAMIDTGSDISTINSEAAQDIYGVSFDDHPSRAAQQGQPSQAGTEAVTVTGWRQQHRFHSLTFGGVEIANPLFVLKPGPSGAHRVGAPVSPDITIGMNVLRKLHLYFAFGERMLYVSAAAR
jgi:hypothetical protein